MDGPRTPEGEVIMAHSMSSSLGCWPTHCPIHQSTAHPSSSPRLTWLGSCNHKCSNGSPSGRFFLGLQDFPVRGLFRSSFDWQCTRMTAVAGESSESLVEPSSSRAHPGLVCHAFLFLLGGLWIFQTWPTPRNRLLSIGFDGTKALQSYELLNQTNPPTRVPTNVPRSSVSPFPQANCWYRVLVSANNNFIYLPKASVNLGK